MYCKNCGTEFIGEEAVVCTTCGVKKGDGDKFCWNCGEELSPGAQFCMKCGVDAKGGAPHTRMPGEKSKIVAGLLGIFLGCFGAHNFYLGYMKKATTQLVATIVGFALSCIGIGAFVVLGISVWGLVEGIMILCGSINVDGNGNPIGD